MNIKDLTKDDIGRSVQYTPFDDCSPSDYEHGHITSFNDTNVFVDYGSNGLSIATTPSDLTFINES